MKDIININEIKDLKKLDNEYDLQKTSLLERKLRLLVKENPELKPVRARLRELIKSY